jgi:hypothetical protein
MLESYLSGEQLPGSAPPWIPFVACGDLAYDADQSYDLGGDYVRREPVQACIPLALQAHMPHGMLASCVDSHFCDLSKCRSDVPCRHRRPLLT